jgi:hypothetical protein
MKMKKTSSLLLLGLLFLGFSAKSQLTINGATFTIESGAVVTVQGDVTSNVDIQGAGKILLKGTANQNVNMNGFAIPNLEVDNAANATLTGSARIGSNGSLAFINGNVILGSNNLTIPANGSITGANSSKFVLTNGTGRLTRASLGGSSGTFTYPIGSSTTKYNPVTIVNTGTADDISARALGSVLNSGTTGTAFGKEVVNTSWDITEAVSGGSTLAVTATWNASDELPGFNRSKTGVSYYVTSPSTNVGWDLLNNQTIAASGTGPYSITRSNVSNLGVFAVGNRPVLSPLLIAPKVFLQGPYNTGTNLMNTSLATLNLIPTTEPYSSLSNFTHSGSGGGETVSGSSFFSSNSIVDWVFVQLHNGTTGAVVSTRSALLKNDGTIVDTDGTPLSMAGNAPGNYFVSIRHRNHLAVRCVSVVSLSKNTNTTYDYTTALSQVIANAQNNAMASVGGKFCMWGGNANSNTSVRYTGGGNDQNQLLNTCLGGNKNSVLSNQYSSCDQNLNGNVRYTGGGNDQNVLLNTVLGGNKNLVISQATF